MRQDPIIRKLYTEAENRTDTNEYLGFTFFDKVLRNHPEYILTLDKVFDVFYDNDYKNDKRTIQKLMVPIWDKLAPEDGDDFYCNILSKFTHTKLIVFGAVIEFIDAFDSFDEQLFKEWMRVVWNVVENTNIDSLTPVSSLIRKFSALIHNIAHRVAQSDSFYYALSQWKEDNDDERENRALLEEVEKARCINENKEWLPVFEEAERHPYFRGMVLFFYDAGFTIEDYKRCYNLAKDMFDENGISPTYRQDHLLIRAIASQFTDWGEIREQYFTEQAETNKYLKNILASNRAVREMFMSTLFQNEKTPVKKALADCIENAQDFTPWADATDMDIEYIKMAVNRIRKDIKLYNWIAAEEARIKNVFRVYWYPGTGNIMFAAPRKQYAKVALDTERAKIAFAIADTYGFEYFDPNQLGMFKQYGDSFGNEIWLKQKRQHCTLWVKFCAFHELKIQFECDTKKYAKELFDLLEGCSYIDEDERLVQIPSLTHFKKTQTINALKKELEDIFDVIPEANKLELEE